MTVAQRALPDPTVQPTISVEEAGRLLGLCRASAYAAVRRGDIPSIPIGHRHIVPTVKILTMLGYNTDPVTPLS